MQDTHARKIVAVYEPSTPSRSAPDAYMSLSEARQMVKERKAAFINHRTAIRMEPESHGRERYGCRGISAAPGPEVMRRFVAIGNDSSRDPEGRAAVNSWAGYVKPTPRAIRCPICDAGVGDPCRGTALQKLTKPHPERVIEAARQATDRRP